ncbi:hypothetical protein CDV56_101307 [Aspergillus thermomutatus]|uniref:Uncharacterized protein n=1 Tax=Aspergillus thermomutatus TaxID=41047 RepID=A0A397G0N5_ASPTH|nr:hypothetical protein CDV56_101307 [Aspergillus thermomutatus]
MAVRGLRQARARAPPGDEGRSPVGRGTWPVGRRVGCQRKWASPPERLSDPGTFARTIVARSRSVGMCRRRAVGGARARLRRLFSYTYPPTSTGPQSCVQTFRGPKVVPGGRPTFAGSPRASQPAMCPGQLATALRHQAARAPAPGATRARPSRPANWRGPMDVENPRDRFGTGPPVVSGERCLAPLQAPGAAGPQQGYLTAYTTRLVTSVVCRGFIPARGDIAIRQPALGGFSPGAVASLLRCMARRPIRIQLRRAGLHRRVPARILT